jgi:outer membrane protein assembly factor BamE (lipoprotein component of BamABCDE complex)
MRRVSVLVLCCLIGCLNNDSLETSSVAENNRYRLRQLCVGMREEEVFARMGVPVKQEQVEIGDDDYDIWFYVTRGTVLDQEAYTHRNLTPIIFKNDKMIGSGYTLYDRVMYLASMPIHSTPQPQTAPTAPVSAQDNEKTDDQPYLEDDEWRMLRDEGDQDFNER